MCRMTTLMSLAWHSKCLTLAMIALVRDGEKSFVSLNNAVKGNIVCHILKCIQNLVSPKECGVSVNPTSNSSLTNG